MGWWDDGLTRVWSGLSGGVKAICTLQVSATVFFLIYDLRRLSILLVHAIETLLSTASPSHWLSAALRWRYAGALIPMVHNLEMIHLESPP